MLFQNKHYLFGLFGAMRNHMVQKFFAQNTRTIKHQGAQIMFFANSVQLVWNGKDEVLIFSRGFPAGASQEMSRTFDVCLLIWVHFMQHEWSRGLLVCSAGHGLVHDIGIPTSSLIHGSRKPRVHLASCEAMNDIFRGDQDLISCAVA